MSALSSSNQSSAEQSADQKHSSTKSLIRWSLGEIKQGSL